MKKIIVRGENSSLTCLWHHNLQGQGVGVGAGVIRHGGRTVHGQGPLQQAQLPVQGEIGVQGAACVAPVAGALGGEILVLGCGEIQARYAEAQAGLGVGHRGAADVDASAAREGGCAHGQGIHG